MHSTLFVQFALGGGRWDGRDILSPPVVVPPSLSAQHLPTGHVPSGETEPPPWNLKSLSKKPECKWGEV